MQPEPLVIPLFNNHSRIPNELSCYPQIQELEASVLFFNGMYKLPISPEPGFQAEMVWQNKRLTADYDTRGAAVSRFNDFFGSILQKELNESQDLIEHAADPGLESIDVLVELADLLGDIIVYCTSEAARFGIPMDEVLKIIMASNFSKLDENGQPIYDADGKVCKGPNYWKPEPRIKELLLSLQADGSYAAEKE